MLLGSDRDNTDDGLSSVISAHMQYMTAVKDGKLLPHLTTDYVL